MSASPSGASAPTMVEITRRSAFEASHRYWVLEWSDEENRRRFGPCTSPFGHGHNYAVEVTVRGTVDPRTGMVVNIVEIDRALTAVLSRLDHRFINVEVEEFRSVPGAASLLPCCEALARYLRQQVDETLRANGTLRDVHVVSARVAEDETLAAECRLEPCAVEGGAMAQSTEVISLVRSYSFSAAHRLHAAALSDEENRAVFGKCNNPHGHGHTYQLDVTVAGVPDPRTGMVTDLAELDAVVQEHVLAKVDHRHLNHEVPPFDTLNPTSENVARIFWEWLEPVCPGLLVELTLHETPRSRFTLRRAS